MQFAKTQKIFYAQTAVIALVTVAALAFLGVVAAYWTWEWFAPRSELRAQAVADPGGHSKSANSLFGNLQQDRNVATPTGIAIRLLGIVAATSGQNGYAVVQIEPKQILAVREGEEIAPGIRLAEVGTDHIVLERSGSRESLAWPEKNKPTEPVVIRTNR